MNKLKTFNKYWAAIILAFSFIVFILLKSDMRWLLCANVPYIKWSLPYAMAPVVRFGWYLWATLAAVSVLSVVCLFPDNKLFSVQGTKTLTIYLYHFFPIYVLDKVFGYSTSSFIILLLIAFLIFMLTIILHELRFVRFTTHPLSIYTDKRLKK